MDSLPHGICEDRPGSAVVTNNPQLSGAQLNRGLELTTLHVYLGPHLGVLLPII